MARGAAQTQRKRAQTQPKRKQKAPSWEDQLFFSRLRRHAKWMFVLLALAFAIGFVAFGVGSGSSGIGSVVGDIFNGGSSSSLGSRIEDAQKKVAAHPRNTGLYINVATLQQQDGDLTGAAQTLESALRVKPKDVDILSQLASVRRAEAATAQTAFNNAESALASNNATPPGLFDVNSQLGQALTSDPLSQALKTQATDEYSKLGTAYTKTEQAYQRLAAAARGTSQEATAQLQLGSVARDTFSLFTNQPNHAKIAIAAYQRYLKLEPDGVQANLARQTVAQLKAFLAQSPG